MALPPELLEIVATSQEGVLATIKHDGRPQLSNIFYLWDAATNVASISTTADRAKGRNLARDPRASLYVQGPDFWVFAVAEGDVELLGPTTEPGDEAGEALLTLHKALAPSDKDDAAILQQLVADKRLVVRLKVTHVYGLNFPR